MIVSAVACDSTRGRRPGAGDCVLRGRGLRSLRREWGCSARLDAPGVLCASRKKVAKHTNVTPVGVDRWDRRMDGLQFYFSLH